MNTSQPPSALNIHKDQPHYAAKKGQTPTAQWIKVGIYVGAAVLAVPLLIATKKFLMQPVKNRHIGGFAATMTRSEAALILNVR